MNEPEGTPPQYGEIIESILDRIQGPVKAASQLVNSILILILVNISSGTWLAFVSYQNLGGHIPLSSFIFVAVTCSALPLIKLYLILQEIISLPDQVITFFQENSQKVSELRQVELRIRSNLKDENWHIGSLNRGKKWQASNIISVVKNIYRGFSLWNHLRSFLNFVRNLRDIRSILGEFDGLTTLVADIMTLTHPIFLIIVIITIAMTTIWSLVAVATFLIYVL